MYKIIARPSFGEITRRQVACRDDRPAAGEDHRRHAVPAAQVEDGLAANVAEPLERAPHPRLVVEIVGVAEAEAARIGGERNGPLAGLAVVKCSFALQALRRRHDSLRAGGATSYHDLTICGARI